ncbi:MAG: hypothetical protein C0613_02575 [Desulfobulbaceae bacterium]|nr:MAG: hypothetical protein C0613_02575 [Desulfobulbaceae bacterium]
MEIDTIIATFTRTTAGVLPTSALQAAARRQKEITPHLIDLLDRAGRDIDGLAQRRHDYGFLYAMFLLAQFREPRALPPLLTFFKQGPKAIALTGDVVTESLGQLLAAVSDGEISAIQELVEDNRVDPFVRAAGIEALLCLTAWGETSPTGVITYFGELINSRLERQPSHVWNYLAEAGSRLCGANFSGHLKRAYDEGLVSPLYMDWQKAEKLLNRPTAENRADLENDEGLQPITDVVAEMSGWACFRPRQERLYPQNSRKPVVHTGKIGRNEPCPCGSGKKYKKCCLGKN